MTSVTEDLNKSFYLCEKNEHSEPKYSQYFLDRDDCENDMNVSIQSNLTERSDYNHSHIDKDIFTMPHATISSSNPIVPQDKTINKYMFSSDSQYDLRHVGVSFEHNNKEK